MDGVKSLPRPLPIPVGDTQNSKKEDGEKEEEVSTFFLYGTSLYCFLDSIYISIFLINIMFLYTKMWRHHTNEKQDCKCNQWRACETFESKIYNAIHWFLINKVNMNISYWEANITFFSFVVSCSHWKLCQSWI